MAVSPGVFLKLPDDLGFGKLERLDGDTVHARLFHSVAEQESASFPVSSLRRAYLSKGTRVYVTQEGVAAVGRVAGFRRLDDGTMEYDIQYPNQVSLDHRETDLDVRCWRCRGNPADILSAGAAETQWLHDRRLAATQRVFRMLASVDGITSLLSSGIELVSHQVSAVRRVLSDPVMRYLLADEVGMGKTIEAGLIIRQCLLDEPRARVVVLAPATLVEQWEGELESKFYVNEFPGAVEVLSHEQARQIETAPTLLVIDEAHRIDSAQDGGLYDVVARLAQKSQRLLLLSATPALADASKFLQLLRLLDAQSYGEETLEGFTARLSARREFGRLILGLASGGAGLVLRRRAAQAAELFPQDPVVADLARQLEAATRDPEGQPDQIAAMLRSHISDAYRVNQRVIRGRRLDVSGWEFQRRGPLPTLEGKPSLSHIRVDADDDRRSPVISDCLEEWRTAAASFAESNAELTDPLASRFSGLIEAYAVGVDEFRRAVENAQQRAACHTFPGEAECLAALLEACQLDPGARTRIDVVQDSIRLLHKGMGGHAAGLKIVAFASSTSMAELVHARLSYGVIGEVELVTHKLSRDEVNNALERFKNQKSAWLLVLDLSGEEGLNLAFADAIVHIDLPMSPARIEQRIGRVDRFGRRKKELRQRVILPFDDEGSVWSAWQDALAESFCIYSESISDVQFVLDDLEQTLIRHLFTGGTIALQSQASSIRTRILAEREAQDEQYALDRVAGSLEQADAFIQRLDDAEGDEAAVACDLEPWLVDSLRIERSFPNHHSRDVFRLKWTDSTLVPSDPWKAEFGLETATNFTWKRRVALENPGLALLGPGTRVVDGSERFMRWDDRGTTFMTWRIDPEWPERFEPWIGFRLCFLIEPSMPEISEVFAKSNSMGGWRRAQQFLAPSYWVLHVDANGDLVEDPAKLKVLERPYQKTSAQGRSDVNLGSRLHVLNRVVERVAIPELCAVAQREGRRALLGRADVRTKLSGASELAKADAVRRNLRLRTRGAWDANSEAIKAEIALNELIAAAVSSPSIRLDAMGMFVVTCDAVDLSHGTN